MSKKEKTLKGIKTPSRRKFFKVAAETGAAAAASVAMPNIAFGAPQTLKMQAAWPSGANIFFEMAKDYCDMVGAMSGGELKIDLQPVGAIVKTGEIGQAVSSGVLVSALSRSIRHPASHSASPASAVLTRLAAV